MNRCKATSLNATLCLVSSAMPALITFTAAGGVWQYLLIGVGIIMVLSTSGSIFYPTWKIFCVSSILFFCAIVTQNAFYQTKFSSGIPVGQISCLSGTAVYDSSFTHSDKSMIKIMSLSCSSPYGVKTSSKGMVVVIAKPDNTVAFGTKVTAYGRFADDLFIADSVEATSLFVLNEIRQRILLWMEKRLDIINDMSSRLSILLLTGKAYEGESTIKKLASECGCMHVLAISGMHVGIIISLCHIIRNKGTAAGFSALLVFMLVLLAGPRPSVVRSALMFYLTLFRAKSDTRKNLIISYFIQALILPYSITDLGGIYGYAATGALVSLFPVIRSFFNQFMPSILASFLSSQAAVIMLTAPLQMIYDGKWFPCVAVAGPLSSFAVQLSMIVGIFILILGRQRILCRLNMYIYKYAVLIFEVASQRTEPDAWTGYIILFSFITASAAVPFVLYRFVKRKTVCVCTYDDKVDMFSA